MSVPGMRRAAVGLTVLAAAALSTVAVNPIQAEAGPKPVDVQLLALNDFHGHLEPPTGSAAASTRRRRQRRSTRAAPNTSPPSWRQLRGAGAGQHHHGRRR